MYDDDQQEKPVDVAPRQETVPAPSEGLEQVFREHHAQVYRAAYRITGNAMDAEDALQTVFVRLLRRDDAGFVLSDRPGSYLHRAAVNAGLDIVRSRTSARSTPLDDVQAHLARDDRESPDRQRAGSEIRDHLREALTRLSPRAAEVFVLRYIEGYGNKEIARMLNVSRTAIAVILHRARHRLREELGGLVGETS